jgi:apolipoprotein N-acyltransferase
LTETLYSRYGDWFAWGCLVLSAAAAAIRRRYSDS